MSALRFIVYLILAIGVMVAISIFQEGSYAQSEGSMKKMTEEARSKKESKPFWETMTARELMDALAVEGQIISQATCSSPNSTDQAYTCAYVIYRYEPFILAYDKQGTAFIFYQTPEGEENKLLWQRAPMI